MFLFNAFFFSLQRCLSINWHKDPVPAVPDAEINLKNLCSVINYLVLLGRDTAGGWSDEKQYPGIRARNGIH